MDASRTFRFGLGLAFLFCAPYLAAEDKELPGNLAKGSDIIGDKVVNDQGQNLGEVHEIVIDRSTGKIAYVVVSYGGFLGIGDKYFAIPWQSFRQSPGKDKLVLNVDKDQMKNAPGFDKNRWPEMNPQWARQLDEYYGVHPAGEALALHIIGFDFGEKDLKREALELPLKFQQGKSFHYIMEMKPHGQAGFSSPSTGTEGARPELSGKAVGCKHDAWLKVTEVSGDEGTLSFTFDASNCEFCKQAAKEAGREPPGKATYTVRANKKGEVFSFQPEGGGAAGQTMASWEPMMKLQLRQLLGHGLHDQRLEPGKTYDAEWTHPEAWQKVCPYRTAGGETSRPADLKTFQLRYDGHTRTEDVPVGLFTVVPAGGWSSGAIERADRQYGQTNFRTEDGLLERFALVVPAYYFTGKPDQKGPGMEGDMEFTIRRTE